MLGRSLGRADLIVLGAAGGLLHVWNHALFKALLFLGAGSVIHATHTREIDHLGGLSRRMPYTAFCFLVGAVAICGLPPLNGFISEFLIYLSIFGTLEGSSSIGAALSAPALALALRFVPYSDDHGHFNAFWTAVIGVCFLLAIAASFYLVSVLEILKLRQARLRQLVTLRRAVGRPAPEPEEVDSAVERELETGTFPAVDPETGEFDSVEAAPK